MTTVQRSNGLNKPCVLLIVIAGMERFAYKGVASNLVTYLTDVVKMSNSAAAKTVNSWCGFTSIVPLLLATLADSYWDHYTTIMLFSFLYLLGLMALTSTSLVWAWIPTNKTSPSASSSSSSSSAALYWSLYMISLGQGGYNPSLQAFGADQLEDTDDPHLPTTKNDETRTKTKPNNTRSLFFQWWYFGICSGSLLGVSLMSYVQDTIGWGLGFAIPTMAMLASIVFFTCGTRFYAYKQPKDGDVKPFVTVFHTIKSMASRFVPTCCRREEHTDELELQETPLCKKGYGDEEDELSSDDEITPKSSIYLMENVRVVIRLLPIWAMLLTFAVIFQQPATFFTKQGVTMKRNIGQNFKIPPAALQSAITISIIILMPLYDKVLIPLTQMITRQDKGISVMQRMGIGMFLSVIAMIIAAIIETKRRESTVDLSIFWLLPQYILLGISDIFTVVGMQEFFYSEVPVRMKTMGIALYTSVFGVGSFMSAFLISLIEFFTGSGGGKGGDGWFSDDMKEARLDKYYWLLAIMSSLSLLLYIVLCRCFRTMNDSNNDKL